MLTENIVYAPIKVLYTYVEKHVLRSMVPIAILPNTSLFLLLGLYCEVKLLKQ